MDFLGADSELLTAGKSPNPIQKALPPGNKVRWQAGSIPQQGPLGPIRSPNEVPELFLLSGDAFPRGTPETPNTGICRGVPSML